MRSAVRREFNQSKRSVGEGNQRAGARAPEHGLTTEAEVARILEEVLVPDASLPARSPRSGSATALRDLAMEFPELQDLDFSRDPSTARAASFE